MSGQYRFGQEPSQSPFNRQPPQNNQNVSYKTNINRMKTKKWVDAKKNAYDGDDWGDYDEYDEYGVDEPPLPPPPVSSARSYGQPSRSFTDPTRQPLPQLGRRSSFEAGDEHRSFSATMPPPPSQGYAQQPQAPPQRHVSAASDFSDTPQHRRDFEPSALPPPLQTKVSPTQGSFGSPTATSPRQRAPSNSDKPLPLIRPADIYKRVEEERQRERASLDSQRPSLDSLAARPNEDLSSPQERARSDNTSRNVEAGRSLQPLETVAERKSEYLPGLDVTKQDQSKQPVSQVSDPKSLPQLPGISAFDNDFWSSGQQSQAPTSHTPVVSPPDDQGFRSVVDQAFTRRDDQHSVPPTPISKESDSIVSRSNTGSTSGISPIMSRVPSSATSALKNRNTAGLDSSTPVIAEESSEANTPVSRPTSMAVPGAPQQMVARKPSPAHSRNVSSSSLPLATPSRGESPARSPALAPQKNLPEPESAKLASSNQISPAAESDYSTREADIAAAMKLSLEKDAPELRSAEKQSQDAFLESHKAQSPISDVIPRSRSESPSKNRVQALAGKFGDVSHSRRGSTQSNASIQSWEKSQNNSRAPSPTKELANTKPVLKTEHSFRPKLPGQWESFATTAATPSEQGDREKELGAGDEPIRTIQGISSPLEEVDLTPTTSKHPVSAAEPSKPIPPAKDTPESEDVPPPPPLKDAVSETTSPTSPQDGAAPQLSTDLSADDQESDRLRKEIVASLTPVQPSEQSVADAAPASLRASSPSGTNRASSILPSEYDSYWEDSVPPSQGAAQPPAINKPPTAEPSDPSKLGLLSRFSWEDRQAGLVSPDGQARADPVAQDIKAPQEENVTSPVAERAVQEDPKNSFDIPEPYFGPTHTPAIAEPAKEPEASDRAPTPPQDSVKLTSPILDEIDREPTPVSGLHVVNSALNPEAVDIPPRLTAEATPESEQPPASHEEPPVSHQTKEPESTEPATSPSAIHEPAALSPTSQSPTSNKPLGFRDIVTLKSSSDRIEKYNLTRDYWAHADHGLGDWIASTVEANPELTTQTYPQVRPELAHSATTKHKHTGSISIFGQHHSGASQTPTTPTSSANPPPLGSHAGRITSHQMQAKGKDLLHTAGVLGGKGMTGAKGLFAKGKSRFGRDKVDK